MRLHSPPLGRRQSTPQVTATSPSNFLGRGERWGTLLLLFLDPFSYAGFSDDVTKDVAQGNDTQQSSFLSAFLLFLLVEGNTI